jgi:hypothetical protein
MSVRTADRYGPDQRGLLMRDTPSRSQFLRRCSPPDLFACDHGPVIGISGSGSRSGHALLWWRILLISLRSVFWELRRPHCVARHLTHDQRPRVNNDKEAKSAHDLVLGDDDKAS